MATAPTMGELNCLWRILRKATHRNVADAMLRGFMWACWPEWYERNKWDCYKELKRNDAVATDSSTPQQLQRAAQKESGK